MDNVNAFVGFSSKEFISIFTHHNIIEINHM